ncbi:Uu.00g104760.m01.CDS01 [Anthostomella pinea]|uniref:Uu.00g104760.m01.CDS01 n=1 Tax=Anthostomella pinea TaxID=933095 RepID=A0AAI8VEU4_9PEZI|nr:Uu.00g104760.m01.CDS01 [Anthostomella pinea]
MSLKYNAALGLCLTSASVLASLFFAPEADASHLSSRAFSIKADGSSTAGEPWPDGKVTWCLNGRYNDNTRKKVLQIANDAWQLWEDALDGKSSLEFKPADDDNPLCGEVSDADTEAGMLHIRLLKGKNAFSSVGHTDEEGSKEMKFSLAEDYGGMDPVVNFAHELGHVFGLVHEHQRPSAWGSDGGASLLKLNCENLADYDIAAAQGLNMDVLCRDHWAASQKGFSALDFLPLAEADEDGIVEAGAFDWDSIMLYNSHAGAKQVGGTFQPTLVKKDGSEIGINKKPSKGDAAAVIKLYPK